ncbi:MAG: alanine racemase [Candidatus Sumerlaeia bacterium]
MTEPVPTHSDFNQWAVIRPDAIRHNLKILAERLPAKTTMAAVIKSDGYGHGMIRTARAAADAGVRFLAVIEVWEAEKLRNKGFQQDILMIGPTFPQQAESVVATGSHIFVGNLEVARALDAAAKKQGTTAKVHLKIDTGMGRFGFLDKAESFHAILDVLGKMEHIEIVGAATHFSEADEPESPYTEEQSRRFRFCLRMIKDRGFDLPWIHAANSGALVHFPNAAFSLVRAGIAMYGACPGPQPNPRLKLKPAMSLMARLIDIRDVPPGSPISYGRTFTTSRPTRLGLLPIGYGHGYPRHASGKARVIIGGKSAPILGRVTMNLICIDLTDCPESKVGDVALLFGENGKDRLPVEELAEQAETISYEILCNVGRSIPILVQ